MIFPETEGKSLQDIEYYFSDRTRKFTDRHIRSVQFIDNDTDGIAENHIEGSSTFSTSSTVTFDNIAYKINE